MVETYLNRLPGELIYELFSYFSCTEILKSFYSINEHFNQLIIGYNSYLLDLTSENISKTEVDLLCSIIHPKQIIGLKIGRTLFSLFDRYFIDLHGSTYLTNLRSLWTDKTILLLKEKYSKWFYSNIIFNNLISFRTDSFGDSSTINRNRLKISYENLTRLVGGSSFQFIQLLNSNIPKQLTFLHMFFDSVDDFYSLIDINANQLKSLGIGIKCPAHDIQRFSLLFQNYQWTNLIQLNLNLQEINDIQWTTMKLILSPMYKLKYLTLIFHRQDPTDNQLFDGIGWQLFLSINLIYLKKFSLKLSVIDSPEYSTIENCLNSFRTTWWLNEKQCFMEYVDGEKTFITIPEFSRKLFDYSSIYHFALMDNAHIIYANIQEMNVDSSIFLQYDYEDEPCFTSIKRLSLNGYLTKDILNKIRMAINIQTIEYFAFLLTIYNDHQQVAQLIFDMKNLSSICFRDISNLDLFKCILSSFNHIKSLTLEKYQRIRTKKILSSICRLFPCLTYFKLNNHSRRKIRYLLKELIYLEELHISLDNNNHLPPYDKWLKKYTRLRNHAFESQISMISDKPKIFIIWINRNKQA